MSDDIAHDWVLFLPRDASLRARKSYVQTSNAVTEEERRKITAQVDAALASKPTPRGCRLAPRGQSSQIALSEQAYAPGGIDLTVPVTINGKKRHFILDTGASGFALSAATTTGLGLSAGERGLVGGFGDENPASTRATHLRSVRIGDVEFTDCEALVVSGMNGFADGLIGGDVFREFLLTLDYPNKKLLLDPLPERPDKLASASQTLYSEAGDVEDNGTVHFRNRYAAPSLSGWTGFHRFGSNLLLPTQINTAQPLLFLIDTGSETTMVKASAVRPLTKLSESDDVLLGLSGVVKKTYRTGPLVLHFGQLYQPMSSMIALDSIPADGSTTVNGVLGTPTWRQVVLHLDYRDNLMKVEYHGK